MSNLLVRKIKPEDNPSVAAIIRSVMTEFDAVGPGFSIEDSEVDSMFEAYDSPRSVFYVLEQAKAVVGCGGLAPLGGGDVDTCELKKMYFLPAARGKGAGRVLGELLIQEAGKRDFRQIYVETLKRMEAANRLYQKLGFAPLSCSLGNTGHHGCDFFYALDLSERNSSPAKFH